MSLVGSLNLYLKKPDTVQKESAQSDHPVLRKYPILFSLVKIQIQSLNPGFGPKLTLNLPWNHPPPHKLFSQKGLSKGHEIISVNLLR